MVLGVLLLVTVSAGALLRNAGLSTRPNELFFNEYDPFTSYTEKIEEFASDQVLFIAFESPDLLSKPSLDRLRGVVDELRKLPFVRRVSSILDVPEIETAEGTISFDAYADKARANPERASEILDRLRSDPLAGGFLVSRDGRHSLIVIEGDPSPERDEPVGSKGGNIEEGVVQHREVMEIFERSGFDMSKLHQAGGIAVGIEILRQIEFNLRTLFPIVCAVLLAAVFIMFRRLWPVVITGLVTIMAVIWTMGFAVLAFGDISLYIALAPGIIMIIAFSDVIHLCSAYMLELSHGAPKERAIEKACSEVGAACFYTSLTTFAGFMSMTLVPMRAFKQMGLVFGFGVAIALMLAIVLTPILFSVMKQPKPWRRADPSKVHNLLDAFLDRTRGLASGFPWTVVIAFSVLVGMSFYGISRIRIEKNLIDSFTEENRLRIDEEYFSRHFVGTNYLDVFIETPRPGKMLDPDLLTKVSAYQKALEKMSEVDRVISIIEFLEVLHGKLRPEQAAESSLPRTRKDLAQYLFLLEDGADLEQMIDSDRRTMRLSMRLGYDGYAATRRTGDRAMAIAGAMLGDGVDVEVTGLSYILGSLMDNIISGQKRSLIYAFFVISVMMVIAFRSVSAGLWSMIPNAIPIVALGGFVGLVWDPVDSDTLLVAIAAVSIGVDDTIHFLIRYNIESGRHESVEKALERTFHYSGRAIVITSVILAAGFAPFALSDYYTAFYSGTLLPGCFIVALAADLLLVPALVKLGVINFHRSGKGEVYKGRV
jgi:predicted RND superfamily exporter protein